VAALPRDIANSGTVVFAQAIDATYANVISGSGAVTKSSAGILTLSGSNTYTGITTISAGTLKLGASSVLASTTAVVVTGTFDVNGKTQAIAALSGAGGVTLGAGALTSSFSGSSTYSGAMSGTGSLTKAGTGTLILSGVNIYTGATTISAGILSITGSVTSSVTVAASGTLGGTGVITGNVINHGTVTPGASIGTLHIAGDYTQSTGSTLEVELDPLTTDLIIVAGAVTIEPGATVTVFPAAGTYTSGTIYTLISSTGGVSGTFSTLTINDPLIQGVLGYDLNTVFLTITVPGGDSVNPYSNFAAQVTKGNPGRVARYLDTLLPAVGSDLASVFAVLNSLHGKELSDALNQLQPAPLKDFSLAQEAVTYMVETSVANRMRQMTMNNCRPLELGLNFWIDDAVQVSEQKDAQSNPGYWGQTAAMTAGLDCLWTDNPTHVMSGGFFASYSTTWLHLYQGVGRGHTETFYGGTYGTYRWGQHLDLQAIVVGSTHRSHSRRYIDFSTIDRTAIGAFHGGEIDGHLDFGLRWQEGNWLVRPYGSVDYFYLHNSSFKEHGAQSLNLSVKSSNNDLLRWEVGLGFGNCIRWKSSRHHRLKSKRFISASHGFFDGKMGIAREERFLGREYHTRLRGQGGLFMAKGMAPDRYLLVPAVGYTILQGGYSLSFRADAEFAHDFFLAEAGIQFAY
jgi:outer membrane autotransporter protein